MSEAVTKKHTAQSKRGGRAEADAAGAAGKDSLSSEDLGKGHLSNERPGNKSPGNKGLSKNGLERRDFLVSGLAIAGGCGAAALGAAFIGQLRPDAGQEAEANLAVDISAIAEGEQITVRWRGQPVVIRNRSAAEVAAAKAVGAQALEDKAARNANLPAGSAADDIARSAGAGRENWLVFINVCTHLGCPTQKTAEGWFCPCHGSRYDSAARVVKGPANRNMAIPPYRFLSDTMLQIG